MKAGDAGAVLSDRPARSTTDGRSGSLRACAWPAASVIKPGMLTTVQDAGRWGYQARGVPVAGPMDPVSHRLANAAGRQRSRRGAARDHAASARSSSSRTSGWSAITGADFELSLDGRQRAVARAVHRLRPDRGCDSARGDSARARILPCRGGIAVPADARQPLHASGQRHGRRRRPRAGRRRPLAAGRSVVARCARARAARRRSRRCRIGTRRSACCRDRRWTTSRRTRSTSCNRRRIVVAGNSDRMGFRLRGSAADTRARRRHHLRRDAARRAAGASFGPADPVDGGSSDHRRLSEDRDGHRRRHGGGRAAGAGRHHHVRRLHAARRDDGAHRAGARADGGRRSATREPISRPRMRAAFGADRVRSERAARAAHDVSRRRSGGVADRNAEQRRDRDGAVDRTRRRRAGDDARRRIERAGGRRRRAWPGDPAARRRRASDRRRTRSSGRGGDDQRPRPLDDQSRPRRARGLGRHAGNRRRRDLRQRALRRTV